MCKGQALDFSREKLLEALRCVEISTHKKTPILQQHKCVKFSVTRGRAIFQTFDQGSSCDYVLNDPLPDDLSISVIVDHDKFLHSISKSSRKEIKIAFDPDSITIIAEGQSILRPLNLSFANTIPASEIFPMRDDLTPSELVDIWRSVEFTICQDTSKYELKSIMYDGNWVSTTGSHVSVYKTNIVSGDRINIIPEFEVFVKLIGTPNIKINRMEMKKHVVGGAIKHLVMLIHTDIGRLRYMTVLNAYEFPDWRTIEKRFGTYENQFTIQRKNLLDALKRIEAFMDLHKFVILNVTDSGLQVSAQDETGEKATETIDFQNAPAMSEPLYVPVSHDILNNIVSKNGEDLMRVMYKNASSPLRVTMGQKEYVVSPIVARIR